MSKIKAIDPKIVVNGNVDKPYYSIEYYDTSDNKWHIGYGSYELKNVIKWLKTDFDIVEVEVGIIHHGYWITQDGWTPDDYYYTCSICNENFYMTVGTPSDNNYKYCPNCGSRMDKTEKRNS